jgi:hypothetical protein
MQVQQQSNQGGEWSAPASNLSGVLNKNFGAPANMPQAQGQILPQPAPQSPAAGAKIGYEEAKSKYGAQRAKKMQQSGEVGG